MLYLDLNNNVLMRRLARENVIYHKGRTKIIIYHIHKIMNKT